MAIRDTPLGFEQKPGHNDDHEYLLHFYLMVLQSDKLDTVRAIPGRLSAISVFLCKSVFYGAFVWARMALNSQKRRFLARAEVQALAILPAQLQC